MTEWWFYHVSQTGVDAAIPPLLEKCLERRWRVLIVAAQGTIDRLDKWLWTWREDSFLPHGRDGAHGHREPLLLSTAASPSNGAQVAMLLDGAEIGDAAFSRCIVLFDNADETARSRAREQYRTALSSSAPTRYFQQDPKGGWVEKTPKAKASGAAR